MKGFKQFLLRGNVVDLAVAVVMGATFGAVVTAFVKDLLTPFIAAIFGKPDFSAISFTVNNSVFAIGDLINTPALAHVASAEGILAVDHAAGKTVHPLKYRNMPGATYSDPQVASVGWTERAAREAGYDVKVGKFPFSALGTARILGQTEGFVKVVAEKKYDEVLGVHIIGPSATDLIAEACVALQLEITAAEYAHTVHAHPTLTEAVMEAAHAAAEGRAIHI